LTGIEQGRPAEENSTEELISTPSVGELADNQGRAGNQPAAGVAASEGDVGNESGAAAPRRILIGSQRDPAAYRARRQRDWVPIESEAPSQDPIGEGQSAQQPGIASPGGESPQGGEGAHRRRPRGGRVSRERHEQNPQQQKNPPPQELQLSSEPSESIAAPPQATVLPVTVPSVTVPSVTVLPVVALPVTVPLVEVASGEAKPVATSDRSVGSSASKPVVSPKPVAKAPVYDAQDEALRTGAAGLAGANLANLNTLSIPRQPLPPPEPLFPEPIRRLPAATEDTAPVIPGRRQKLTASMEAELERAMGGLSLDDLMSGEGTGPQVVLEPESRHRGRVVASRRDEIFVEFGGREQGCLPARSFETPPQPGEMIEVIVQRFNSEEGLYDLTLPGMSIELSNWNEVQEGMLVDAQITGHNTGGLECEVNRLRGFIPVSQISLYRVEDLAQFVGQRFACLITEVNPSRKNLVLSHKAVLEREQEEKKKIFFESLAPGQVHEGTVRKLMDFGAFVELGNGVDGLLHISQLSWGRIKHPSEVLQEGQAVRVRVEKIDPETGRIGLSYREMTENPWTAAASKYPHNTIVRGKVTRLMEFGAFVELEPGVEGLVHISELSHKRIWRASDAVKEGEEVEVLVLNVNPEAQRMSLSLKGLSKPEPTKKEKEEAQEAELPAESKKAGPPSNLPLKGGLGKSAGGESVGLNW